MYISKKGFKYDIIIFFAKWPSLGGYFSKVSEVQQTLQMFEKGCLWCIVCRKPKLTEKYYVKRIIHSPPPAWLDPYTSNQAGTILRRIDNSFLFFLFLLQICFFLVFSCFGATLCNLMTKVRIRFTGSTANQWEEDMVYLSSSRV